MAAINAVPLREDSGPSNKNFPRLASEGGPTQNLSTKSERLTVSCRASWAWAERSNLYSR